MTMYSCFFDDMQADVDKFGDCERAWKIAGDEQTEFRRASMHSIDPTLFETTVEAKGGVYN